MASTGTPKISTQSSTLFFFNQKPTKNVCDIKYLGGVIVFLIEAFVGNCNSLLDLPQYRLTQGCQTADLWAGCIIRRSRPPQLQVASLSAVV